MVLSKRKMLLLCGFMVSGLLAACGGGGGSAAPVSGPVPDKDDVVLDPGNNIPDPGNTDQGISLFIEKFGQGTIQDDVSGLSCSTPSCVSSYEEGQLVKLSTVPESGWKLNNWSGCDSVVGGVCSVSMSEERVVYPTFSRVAPPTLQKAVLDLDSATAGAITSLQDGAIVFSSDASNMATVPAGTVLISKEGEGFARKVTNVVTLTGSNTIVETTNVPLEEIIGEGTIIYNTPLTMADLVEVQQMPGVTLLPTPLATSTTFTFGVEREFQDGGVTVSGTVEVQLTPDLAIDIGWTGVQEVKTAIIVSVKPLLNVTVKEGVEVKGTVKLPLPFLKFAPVVIGPVVITPEVTPVLEVVASASVNVSMSGWVKVEATAGAHYIRKAGWKGIGSAKTTASFDPLEVTGNSSLDSMIGVENGFKLYSVAGPSVTVGPYVKGSTSYDFGKSCGSWATNRGARAKTKVEGKLFGWNLGSWEMTLLDISQKLAGGEYGACSDTQPPTQPGTPVITNSFPTSIQITWAEATDNVLVDRYEVYRNNSMVAEVTGAAYADKGLTPETQYCYYVVAVDGSDNKSIKSPTACDYTAAEADLVPPSKPLGLTASVLSSSAIKLNWQAATDNVGVVSYLVYQDGEAVDGVAATSVALTSLKAATEYCYQVAALDEAGNASTPSNQVCATTKAADAAAYRVRIKCADAAGYAVDTVMDLDEGVTSNVSVVGSATDYGGTPMTYVLSGLYASDTSLLNGRIDWTFQGNTCSRADTFGANLAASDSGDVTMNQVSVCGCTAQIRFTRGSQTAAVPPSGYLPGVTISGQ